MKYPIFLLLAFLVTGCGAKYPDHANINLQIIPQPSGVYSDNTSATVQGKDLRKDSEIVAYQIKEDLPVLVPNFSAPHIVVSERLAGGLREQGLLFESSSDIVISLNINELLATVSRPKVLYKTKADSHITLTVNNTKKTLTKKYKRQENRESLQRPDLAKLEKMLSEQLSDIVNQILEDEEVRQIIRGN